MKLKPYKSFFPMKEAFATGNIERVVQQSCKVLSKRTGDTFSVSPLVDEVENSLTGKTAGLIAVSSKGKQLRFEWSIGGSSSEITSISYWTKIKFQPDIIIDTKGQNIIQILNAIEQVIQNNQIGQITLTEDSRGNFTAKSQGRVSKDISNTISVWSTQMSIGDSELEKTRISELFKQFQYWYNEVVEDSSLYKNLNYGTFRNYILAYLEKYNLKNIFMRTVVSKKAGREKLIVTDEAQKSKFKDSMYAMSLSDTMEYIKTSLRMVTRGYENTLIIGGKGGIGKTTLVKNELSDEGVKAVWQKGGIKTAEDLYAYLFNHKKDFIVFDDVSIFGKQYLDVLKAVMDDDPKRLMTFESDKLQKKGIPSEFYFEGKVIIITNEPKRKMANAILSRGAYIEVDVGLDNIADDIQLKIKELPPKEVPVKIKQEVLDFIKSRIKSIDQLDFRLFRRCCIYAYMTPPNPNWKKNILPLLKLM